MHSLSSEEFGQSRLERAWEPPEEVILRRELVRTPSLQPEDLGVLAELLLRDPRLPSSMEAIRTDLQARGWKMGKDRYNAIAKRLTTAGHLARVSVFDDATQRPQWVTRVFRNPANNTQYVDLGIAATQQVRTEVRETSDSLPTGSLETRVSPGQSRNAENPRSGSESRKTRDLETRVSPGQSRNAENPRSDSPPPHPPEEVETSSPYPLTDPAGSLPSQREEEAGFAPSDIDAAERFLQELPRPWGAGRATARKCAPLLLGEMCELGWPSIHEVDRQILQQEILRNTEFAKSPAHILPKWIKDLRLYSVVTAKARPQAASSGGREMCRKPGHGGGAFAADDCSECRAARPRREGATKISAASLIATYGRRKDS
ncbi:hypothetical protein ABT275_33560 [Streptomyces sp. NPDC001185]|uniref:hypothetical protein n=1 Tax=Streptomyces sp. NPDC001185 TaxID=3154380 RepID=UPI003333C6A2